MNKNVKNYPVKHYSLIGSLRIVKFPFFHLVNEKFLSQALSQGLGIYHGTVPDVAFERLIAYRE